MSGPEVTLTRGEAIQLTAATLNHIFEAGVVSSALHKAVDELGWTGCQVPVAPSTSTKQTEKKSGKKSGKEEGVKEKTRRSIGPYMLFMNMMMDRITKDPNNPAYKLEEKIDENGAVVPVRGGKMTVASKIWNNMSESNKQAFNATFKPLCDTLNSEVLASGEKHDLTHRLQDFQASLNSSMRKQLEDSINTAVQALAKGKGVNGTPFTASKPAKVVEDSSDDSSSDEPEPVKPAPKSDKKRKDGPASLKKEKKKAKKSKSSSSSSEESD